MKNLKNLLVLIIGLISMGTTCVLSYNLGKSDARIEQEILERHIENATTDNSIKFIWNDDEESIPANDSLIKIEYIDENNVYIGPK